MFERLVDIPEPYCLLCSEKEPETCHRSILAEFLQQRGHEVEHLIAPPRPPAGNARHKRHRRSHRDEALRAERE
jgi:hypothetical protein